jgi:hypothetical protein
LDKTSLGRRIIDRNSLKSLARPTGIEPVFSP